MLMFSTLEPCPEILSKFKKEDFKVEIFTFTFNSCNI